MSADLTELAEKYGYHPPVDQFLTLGDVRGEPRVDYLSLGLGPDDVPELIRLAQDDALWQADGETPEVWAPVHAWRALGDLRAQEAIEPMVALLGKPDPDEFDDFIGEDFPDIFAQLGPAAIPPLATYLRAPGRGMWSRVTASSALQKIAEAFPETRDQVVAIVSGVLEDTVNRPRPLTAEEEILNGNLIGDLALLNATEAMPLIERAYAADRVDPTFAGDLEDIQIKMGLREQRDTPAPNYFAESFRRLGTEPPPLFGFGPDPYPEVAEEEAEAEGFDDFPLAPLPAPGSAAQRAASARKAKSKRKLAKQSRKQNRKKK
jgi:hypothetical protein